MQLLLSERYPARQFTYNNLSSPYEVSTNYYSQCTNEENRPQRNYASCSRLHGWEVGKPEIKPEHPKPMVLPFVILEIYENPCLARHHES